MERRNSQLGKRVWVRHLTLRRGPFEFYYTVTYEAVDGTDGDEFWRRVSVRTNGHKLIKDCPPSQKIELIKKFGSRAARAAHEEAEKLMRVNQKSAA